jgi:hypothetical protein
MAHQVKDKMMQSGTQLPLGNGTPVPLEAERNTLPMEPRGAFGPENLSRGSEPVHRMGSAAAAARARRSGSHEESGHLAFTAALTHLLSAVPRLAIPCEDSSAGVAEASFSLDGDPQIEGRSIAFTARASAHARHQPGQRLVV